MNNGAGGFLVSWHHNIGSLNYVFARIVSFDMPGFLVSGIQQISDGEQGGSWWETGPAMAYSPTSRKFLLAWRTIAYGIRGRFVDTNGSPFGGVMQFENPGGSRDPALAWNAATDEFGLISTGWSSTSALAAFRRIRASDGFISGRTSFGFSAGTFASAIDVNSANQYVLAWALHPGTMSAVFDQNGTQLTSNFVTGRIGHDQSLGMAYNPNSGTFLAVGSDGTSLELAAAEMKSDGEPNTLAQIITDGAKHGSNYPMVSARTNTSQWNVAYERDFGGAVTQFIATSTTGGGSPSAPPAPTPTPTPAPTPGPTLGCTTPDPFASIGGGTCVSGGWVPGRSGGGTPGAPAPGGCTSAAPAPGWTCVNGGWLPPAAGGTGGTGGCTTPNPFSAIGGGTCIGGGWVPGRTGGGTTGGCTTVAPAPGWACVNGGWLPPASGGTGATGGCATAAPASGWTCVNGGWLPPASGGTGGSSCTTPDPFASMGGGTCVSGGWTPGRAPGASTGGCTSAPPGAGWSCVNGGWLPPGTGPVASTCTTADPFASVGGGVCVNGGWTPANFSCTTPDPFQSLGGGVCSNGGWKPR